ncbi:MAG: hypothetical protein HYY76_00770 [Acidobacteria bacterium]|nr:hypothetical protein [Acidobacteriota bacterium]
MQCVSGVCQAATAKDVEKFLSCYAPDASVYPPGMPIATGLGPIRDTITGMPMEMRHFFLSNTAATFQVHGTGPFAVNYVNPADDPSKK